MLNKEYYDTKDISSFLHISVNTLRNKLSRCDNLPPSFRIGRKRLFPCKEFNDWLIKQKKEGNPKNIFDEP